MNKIFITCKGIVSYDADIILEPVSPQFVDLRNPSSYTIKSIHLNSVPKIYWPNERPAIHPNIISLDPHLRSRIPWLNKKHDSSPANNRQITDSNKTAVTTVLSNNANLIPTVLKTNINVDNSYIKDVPSKVIHPSNIITEKIPEARDTKISNEITKPWILPSRKATVQKCFGPNEFYQCHKPPQNKDIELKYYPEKKYKKKDSDSRNVETTADIIQPANDKASVNNDVNKGDINIPKTGSIFKNKDRMIGINAKDFGAAVDIMQSPRNFAAAITNQNSLDRHTVKAGSSTAPKENLSKVPLKVNEDQITLNSNVGIKTRDFSQSSTAFVSVCYNQNSVDRNTVKSESTIALKDNRSKVPHKENDDQIIINSNAGIKTHMQSLSNFVNVNTNQNSVERDIVKAESTTDLKENLIKETNSTIPRKENIAKEPSQVNDDVTIQNVSQSEYLQMNNLHKVCVKIGEKVKNIGNEQCRLNDGGISNNPKSVKNNDDIERLENNITTSINDSNDVKIGVIESEMISLYKEPSKVSQNKPLSDELKVDYDRNKFENHNLRLRENKKSPKITKSTKKKKICVKIIGQRLRSFNKNVAKQSLKNKNTERKSIQKSKKAVNKSNIDEKISKNGECKSKTDVNISKIEENKSKTDGNVSKTEENKSKNGESKSKNDGSVSKIAENKSKNDECKSNNERNKSKVEENKSMSGESKSKNYGNKSNNDEYKSKIVENKANIEGNKSKNDEYKSKIDENYTLTHVIDGIVFQESNQPFIIKPHTGKNSTKENSKAHKGKSRVNAENDLLTHVIDGIVLQESNRAFMPTPRKKSKTLRKENLIKMKSNEVLEHLSRFDVKCPCLSVLVSHEVDGLALLLCELRHLLAIGLHHACALQLFLFISSFDRSDL